MLLHRIIMGETFHSVCHLVENLNFKIVDSSIDVVHRWTTDQLDVLADEWEKVLCYYIKDKSRESISLGTGFRFEEIRRE